jgi:hypothetical protein
VLKKSYFSLFTIPKWSNKTNIVNDIKLEDTVEFTFPINEGYVIKVYDGDICLNELLIQERYAVSYNGKTKVKPRSWLMYKLKGEL